MAERDEALERAVHKVWQDCWNQSLIGQMDDLRPMLETALAAYARAECARELQTLIDEHASRGYTTVTLTKLRARAAELEEPNE